MLRSRWRFAALVGVIVVVLVASACGGGEDEGAADGGAEEDFKAAILTTGAVDNRSWGQANAEGGPKAEEKLGVEVEVVGNLDAPDQYVTQGSAFAGEGFDLLIFAFGAPIGEANRVAKQFPDTQVVQIFQYPSKKEQQQEDEPNTGRYDVQQQQGAFLAGAAAGLATETNTVGTVNGIPVPALVRQPEAFELGARCVNSKVKVLHRYTDSFTDAALARAAASAHIGQDVDVIFGAVDEAVRGIITAADEEGGNVDVIASYLDQDALNPDVVLTSVLYNLDDVMVDIIEKGTNGELGDHFFESYDLANTSAGTLAGFGPEHDERVNAQEKRLLDEIEQKMIDGEISVPDETIPDPKVADGATIGEQGAAKGIEVEELGCDPVR